MAFTSHEIAGGAAPSGKETEGRRSFVVTWRLFCGSGDDGPEAALEYVEAEIARWKDAYQMAAVPSSSSSSPGAGVDQNANAILKSVEVDREKGSANPWVWLAKLTYEEPAAAGSGEKPDGGSSKDPLEFAAEVEIQTVQLQRFAEKAKYLSGYHSFADTTLSSGNKQRPICNSAFAVFDPPPEVDDHRWVIRIKKNLATLDCDTVRCNVVNSKQIRISYRGLSKTIPQYCGKIRDVSAVPVKHPVIGWYVQVQFYIDVDEKHGYRLSVQDRGFGARAHQNDPDGHGGVIQDDDRGLVPEMPPIRRFVDADGNPVSEPQLLDGDGQALISFIGATLDPIYGIWGYYTEEDFGSWPILADLLDTSSSSVVP